MCSSGMGFCRHAVLYTLIILVQKLFSEQQKHLNSKNALKWHHAVQCIQSFIKHIKCHLKYAGNFLGFLAG